MNVITIDFETYYDKVYSLSKLTTEEYIRNPQFEIIGVGIKINNDEPQWASGTHEEVRKWLKQFNWDGSLGLAHNAMFDAAILSWVLGIKPRGWLDTLCMARAVHGTEVSGSLDALSRMYKLGQKGTAIVQAIGKSRESFNDKQLAEYGEYCLNDVSLTYALCQCMIGTFPQDELRLIDLTVRMFSEPVLVLDREMLTVHLNTVRATKQRLIDAAFVDKANLMSNPKFADMLLALGVTPPTKVSPTTNKETYAFAKTDEAFRNLLNHPDPKVQAIVSARLGAKSTLEETRAERFIALSQKGPMPVPLRYYAARTGRWGGDDSLNLQNLPRKSLLRQSICAPEGHMLVDADSSQIEARVLAWIAGQSDLVDAFARNDDVYKLMAGAIYGKDPGDVTEDERFVGKVTILGCGYGMGSERFNAQLKTFKVEVSEEESKRIILIYRETYPQIPLLWKDGQKALVAMFMDQIGTLPQDKARLRVSGASGIELPNTFHIRYNNLRLMVNPQGKEEFTYDMKNKVTRIYGGKVIENVCQALARIIIGEQMLAIAKRYKVALTVHDAITCVVPAHEAEEAKAFVTSCMRERPAWCKDLPLDCKVKLSTRYGEG